MGTKSGAGASVRTTPRARFKVALAVSLAVAASLVALGLFVRNLHDEGASTSIVLRETSPATAPLLIRGTDIPLPPASFGFDPTNYRGLIDVPVNAYLLVQRAGGDPESLKGEMDRLLGYYRTLMPTLGWTLDHEYPLTPESEKGDPSGWYAAAQDWSKGSEDIKVSVSNYAQWYDWGFRLTLTVYASDGVRFPR